jgi:hypothetical protein
MGKKYLHIIALSTIMCSFGNSHATQPECYQYDEKQKDCTNNPKCLWVGYMSPKYCAEGPNTYACDLLKNSTSCINNPICFWRNSETKCLEKECDSLTSGSCGKNVKCSWNSTQKKCSEKESSPPQNNSMSKKESSPPQSNSMSKKESSPPQSNSTSKKPVSPEELCTKSWFKSTCNSARKSKKIDCVWLKSSSLTNAGQKSGCHSKAEFYEKNKEYFDIDPF